MGTGGLYGRVQEQELITSPYSIKLTTVVLNH